jgi:structure-specific recognition protein 1
LNFVTDSKIGFEVPFFSIADASVQTKNHVLLEMKQDDSAPAEEDCLTEIRFLVPALEEAMDTEEVERVSNADAFVKAVTERGNIQALAKADAIVSFENLLFQVQFFRLCGVFFLCVSNCRHDLILIVGRLCQVPRGRFEIEVHPTLLKMRGTTASYNILYPTIKHLFLLQRPDNNRVVVVRQ